MMKPIVVLLGVTALIAPARVDAACNLIPTATQSFRSTVGAANKPYAAPGDYVEVGVRPAACDVTSPGLAAAASDHIVQLPAEPASDLPALHGAPPAERLPGRLLRRRAAVHHRRGRDPVSRSTARGTSSSRSTGPASSSARTTCPYRGSCARRSSRRSRSGSPRRCRSARSRPRARRCRRSYGSEVPTGVDGWKGDLSADGRTVVFSTSASNMLPGDTNGSEDVFARTIDASDTAADRTGDGLLDDTVLGVLDATSAPPTAPTWLCPAGSVAAADGRTAFLRPEAGGATTLAKLPLCPLGTAVSGGIDLNGDSDAADQVVHLWTGSGNVQNLGLAATAVALSSTHVAAISNGTLHTRAVSGGGLTNTGAAAAAIQFCGNAVALLKPVANHLGPSPVGCLGNSGQAVTPCRLEACDPRIPYRVGTKSVRFLTFECDQSGIVTTGCGPGGTDLSGDGDAGDLVIQVYDAETDVVTVIGPIGDESGNPLGPGDPEDPGSGGGGGTVYPDVGRCLETLGACTTGRLRFGGVLRCALVQEGPSDVHHVGRLPAGDPLRHHRPAARHGAGERRCGRRRRARSPRQLPRRPERRPGRSGPGRRGGRAGLRSRGLRQRRRRVRRAV